MVFDGAAHDPGFDRRKIDALLAEAQRRSPRRATPELTRRADNTLAIALTAFDLAGGTADIALAVYDRRHSTPVARGENTGATLENFNVVRRLETVARWKGEAADWTVPADRIGPAQGVAVLVQRSGHGPMLGCNKLEPHAARA